MLVPVLRWLSVFVELIQPAKDGENLLDIRDLKPFSKPSILVLKNLTLDLYKREVFLPQVLGNSTSSVQLYCFNAILMQSLTPKRKGIANFVNPHVNSKNTHFGPLQRQV
jgi:hypothetical protein